MANNTVEAQESFIIPARTLRGSRQEMVQDIDQAIVGLLALRHLIGAAGGPVSARTFGRDRRSGFYRIREWLGLPPAKLSEPTNQRGSPQAS